MVWAAGAVQESNPSPRPRRPTRPPGDPARLLTGAAVAAAAGAAGMVAAGPEAGSGLAAGARAPWAGRRGRGCPVGWPSRWPAAGWSPGGGPAAGQDRPGLRRVRAVRRGDQHPGPGNDDLQGMPGGRGRGGRGREAGPGWQRRRAAGQHGGTRRQLAGLAGGLDQHGRSPAHGMGRAPLVRPGRAQVDGMAAEQHAPSRVGGQVVDRPRGRHLDFIAVIAHELRTRRRPRVGRLTRRARPAARRRRRWSRATPAQPPPRPPAGWPGTGAAQRSAAADGQPGIPALPLPSPGHPLRRPATLLTIHGGCIRSWPCHRGRSGQQAGRRQELVCRDLAPDQQLAGHATADCLASGLATVRNWFAATLPRSASRDLAPVSKWPAAGRSVMTAQRAWPCGTRCIVGTACVANDHDDGERSWRRARVPPRVQAPELPPRDQAPERRDGRRRVSD